MDFGTSLRAFGNLHRLRTDAVCIILTIGTKRERMLPRVPEGPAVNWNSGRFPGIRVGACNPIQN